MPHESKTRFLAQLAARFPDARKMPNTQSLYELGGGARIYIRYSKLHPGKRTFYGLRQADLRELEGRVSVICFLWDNQEEPVLVPFKYFEEVFSSLAPASDGQFKVQVYPDQEGTEMYVANAGRFNVESYVGWNETNDIAATTGEQWNSQLRHNQVQTLLAAIGAKKGHDVWVPMNDRAAMDWALTSEVRIQSRFVCAGLAKCEAIASEVDVVWLRRGSGEPTALFEVEHSTPVYSGLLRFNDVHLVWPSLRPRFTIVANDLRRSLFTRQINRPTFTASGLSESCTFLDYANVYEWHHRLSTKP